MRSITVLATFVVCCGQAFAQSAFRDDPGFQDATGFAECRMAVSERDCNCLLAFSEKNIKSAQEKYLFHRYYGFGLDTDGYNARKIGIQDTSVIVPKIIGLQKQARAGCGIAY